MNTKFLSLSLASIGLLGMMASTSAFAASTPPPHHGGFGGGPGGFMTTLPSVLGISKTTLQADMKAGKTILQIAESKKISEATLISKLEAAQKAQLNKLVAGKKMTAAKEKQALTRYDNNIKKMITSKWNAHPFPNRPNGQPPQGQAPTSN